MKSEIRARWIDDAGCLGYLGPRWLGWWWIFIWWEYVVWQFDIMMMGGFFWMSCDKTLFILSRYLYMYCVCVYYMSISIFDILIYTCIYLLFI